MNNDFAGTLKGLIGPARVGRAFEVVRYGIVGVSNVLIDFAIYIALTRGSDFWRRHYLWANLISFVIVVTWSFFWNKFWTFKERSGQYRAQYAKFVLITVVGIGIYQSVLYIGVERLHLIDVVAKVLAIPVMALWNYFMHRGWTFARAPKSL